MGKVTVLVHCWSVHGSYQPWYFGKKSRLDTDYKWYCDDCVDKYTWVFAYTDT